MHEFDSFSEELRRLRVDLGEQLRRLRAEHNALCACLDGAGVISKAEMEQQLSRQSRRGSSQPEAINENPMRQSRSSRTATKLHSNVPASSSAVAAPAGPETRSMQGINKAQSSARAPQSIGTSGERDRSWKDSAPQTGMSSRSSNDGNGAGRPQSREKTENLTLKDPTSMPSNASVDLYDAAHPLLFHGVRPALKQKALADVKHLLILGKRPDVWRGPDTPLLAAHEAGCRDLVAMLLSFRANPNVQNEKGASVLHRAVFRGEPDYVNLFLEAQADPNLGDQHDQTPVFFAPTTSLCQMLCRRNADTNIVNLKGQSALHLAALGNLGDVLVWLSQHVSRQLLDMKDNDGFSAEDYARREGMKPEMVKRMRPYDPHHPVKRPPVGRSKRGAAKKVVSKTRTSVTSSRSSIRSSTRNSIAKDSQKDSQEDAEADLNLTMRLEDYTEFQRGAEDDDAGAKVATTEASDTARGDEEGQLTERSEREQKEEFENDGTDLGEPPRGENVNDDDWNDSDAGSSGQPPAIDGPLDVEDGDAPRESKVSEAPKGAANQPPNKGQGQRRFLGGLFAKKKG